MGDVGALAIGAALGTLAVIVRQEIVLFVMGGVFVLETVSVMLQVASFKLTGKRIFRMAPIHHHFELKGWAGAESDRAFLDHQLRAGVGGSCNLEDPLMHSVVVGLGKTGASCLRYLAKRGIRGERHRYAPRAAGARRIGRSRGLARPAARRLRSVAARRRLAGADVARGVARGAHRARGAGARHRGAGRCGAVRAQCAGAGHRHHRHQRQEHGHEPGGAHGRRRGAHACWPAAIWACRRSILLEQPDSRSVRAGAVELSIGDHLLAASCRRRWCSTSRPITWIAIRRWRRTRAPSRGFSPRRRPWC